MTNNQSVLSWLQKVKDLVKPADVMWIDGTEEQLEMLRKTAVQTGEMIKLNQEKMPGCYLHRTAENDVARVEGRTFICSRKEEDAGPTNHWMDPQKCYKMLFDIARGSYAGRTMYIIPYSMGPVGSPFAKVGVEVTDSIYVVLNMSIMTRVGNKIWDVLGDSNDWVRGLHCKCNVDPDKRYICQFPEDNTIISVNSAYGGNVLLGKKCFALRIASYQGKQEGWMAEHMLILGIQNPKGEIKYVSAAFPSGCGKTNLAMLIPPEGFRKKGYKIFTVGDDIAWMRIGPDGRLWAINPENGFFGIAPGTNNKSNPNALATTRKGTIFTNVALNKDDNTVWWEGLDKNPPENGVDWKGRPWNGKTSKEKGAHPNSRFTAPAKNCPCISPEFDKGTGVPISAIIFGGRRAQTTPLVYQSRGWNNGVFVGSIMASETTAAASGAVGVVRRDPMAMLPFCGYNMGDYFAHWIEMGKKLGDKAPKIFNVNWFRLDKDGNFLWPGFGDNLRVLDWILDRCDGKANSVETPIGYVPTPEDIDMTGLEDAVSPETMKDILTVDKDQWRKEADAITEHYKKFGDRLPKELSAELAALKQRLQ
ncbi:phosphoenolpyruvate carboxykinase (GTP) [Caproicibacterium lactatifermentans]|jgi:phosphoenolpyruvate carboxykinase (GTP)|uniref:Phosphoenolpyruvate carboxykinase [GTP] n=1 Tax=Caproicibacterium lactatifermentans TaxID=2666138 RepID=A0A859DT92_9FIRM|nr:phosphoenolpyruvate carboxykinase (GTP) [Caproicibacterium lactatifermentans]ARP51043.1 phosphoenolpyruvate carboxykinase (GTP) [Ruminococcaceae bacterium CPB6]QKN23231.1 phosphoenolpyruvate carboxykinase (GTP) [Caproicibacterium lactatifermentans]QKO30087.1 phosphoenolpyruvate carboxykinase (GTP) [Caproicibacterium lactatifermentans]